MGVILPDNILSKLSPQDRAEISRIAGNPNAGMTANEARKKAMERSEKEAQKEICQLLSVKGIELICPPMNRKSSLPVGWPDMSFAYKPKGCSYAVPTALEVKVWGAKPRPEQSARHEAMRRNGWLVYVVSGAAEVQDIFRDLDAEHGKKGGLLSFLSKMLGIAANLLRRWVEWARSHGHAKHAEGIFDDTQQFFQDIKINPLDGMPDPAADRRGRNQ